MTAVAEQAKLNALFERLPDLVSADGDLVRRGALCNAEVEVGIGETLFYLRIAGGRVAVLERQASPPRPTSSRCMRALKRGTNSGRRCRSPAGMICRR